MTTTPRIVLLIVTTATIALTALPAIAQQSPSELRRENERLRASADALRRELESPRADLLLQRADNARLIKQLAAARLARPVVTPNPPPAVTVDETKANASPRGLFNVVVVKGYQETTAELFIGNDEDDADRIVYERRVDRWVRRVNRELKTPIEWHVRIDDPTNPLPHAHMLRLVVVDPKTDVRLGDPFDVGVTRALMSRLKDMEKHRELSGVLMLRGVLRPMIRFNRDRFSEGTFNKPPFVGPFAEFAFSVDATSLVVRSPEIERADKDENTDGSTDAAAQGESRHDR